MNEKKDIVTDVDGNVYSIVKIGTQLWTVENLKTTRYNDGSEIPLIFGSAETWYELNAPGYCWYNDDESTKTIMGALYNWHVVNTGKLCPDGWRVPTDEDWNTLIEYLGGEKLAGSRMKAIGTRLWSSPNTGANNLSGFTALPAGFRGKGGFMSHAVNSLALFWSSTAFDDVDAWTRYLQFDSEIAGRNNGGKYHGFSVRCVKNN